MAVNVFKNSAVFAVLVLAGCAPKQYSYEQFQSQSSKDTENRSRLLSYTKDTEWNKKVTEGKRPKNYQDVIKSNLKEAAIDPDSLKVEFVPTLESGLVCGSVNSKNSMGGYTGKQALAVYFDPSSHISRRIWLDPDLLRVFKDRTIGSGQDDASLLRLCGFIP